MIGRSLPFFALGYSLTYGQDEGAFVPFSETSAWQPVPEGLTAGREGDQIVLKAQTSDLLGISQSSNSEVSGLLLRVNSVTGPEGSKAVIRYRDKIETPYIAGIELSISPDGTTEVQGRAWEGFTITQPQDRLTFPFWVQMSWGLSCHLSQDGVTWQEVASTAITFPPSACDIMIQSSQDGQEAVASFSEVTLLGADANDNGITDGWERQHFGGVLKISSPSDPDGDGRSNQQEWLDLTDPTRPDNPIETRIRKTGEGFRFTLSKAVLSGLTFEKSTDLKHWETVNHTEFDLSTRYLEDLTEVNFTKSVNKALFYRAVFKPQPDPYPWDIFPANQ